jgi:hypothetical protein
VELLKVTHLEKLGREYKIKVPRLTARPLCNKKGSTEFTPVLKITLSAFQLRWFLICNIDLGQIQYLQNVL